MQIEQIDERIDLKNLLSELFSDKNTFTCRHLLASECNLQKRPQHESLNETFYALI